MSRPLRIAFFTGTFPVVSETFIIRQIAGLIDLGHQVDIYANWRPDADVPMHPEVAEYKLLERVTYIDAPAETTEWEMPAFPVTERTWPPGSERSIPNWVRVARAVPKLCKSLIKAPGLTFEVLNRKEYGYQATSLSALHRLATLCSKKKPYDALHAHFGPVGKSFRFARKLWGAPLCVSFHGYDFSTVPRQEGLDTYHKLFSVADAVMANSDYTRSKLEALGCPPERLHKLPVGLDPAAYSFRERSLIPGQPIRILSIGRLVEIKGHEYAIQAVGRLRDSGLNVHFDIGGDGPLRPSLETLIHKLCLDDVVKLHGALSTTAVEALLEAADLFVLASVTVEGDQEGQGLALQEAQAAGLPVVATRHGALPEGLLPDESGFLVPERDVDALTDRLKFLVAHPELWPMIGRKGRSFVEARYDLGKLSRQLVTIYEGMIEHYPQSRNLSQQAPPMI